MWIWRWRSWKVSMWTSAVSCCRSIRASASWRCQRTTSRYFRCTCWPNWPSDAELHNLLLLLYYCITHPQFAIHNTPKITRTRCIRLSALVPPTPFSQLSSLSTSISCISRYMYSPPTLPSSHIFSRLISPHFFYFSIYILVPFTHFEVRIQWENIFIFRISRKRNRHCQRFLKIHFTPPSTIYPIDIILKRGPESRHNFPTTIFPD